MQPTASARMITLDGWNEQAQLERCDLIKVDIEGYEYEFLCGAMRFVEAFRPIIFGEFNRYFLRQFGHSFACFRGMLEPYGYAPLALQRWRLVPVGWEDGLENVLLVPRERMSALGDAMWRRRSL